MTTQNSGVPKRFWATKGCHFSANWHLHERLSCAENEVQKQKKTYPRDQCEILPLIELSVYDQAIARAEKAEATLDEMNQNCTSLGLHESRMQSLEAEVKRLKHLLDRAHEQFMEMYEWAKQALEPKDPIYHVDGGDDWGT